MYEIWLMAPYHDISEIFGGWEAVNVVEELGGGLEIFLGQPEPQVVNVLFSKDKFLGAEYDALQTALV